MKIILIILSFFISICCFSQQIKIYEQFRNESVLPNNFVKFNSIDRVIQLGLDSIENRQILPFSIEKNRYCYQVDFYDNGQGLFYTIKRILDRNNFLSLTKNNKDDFIFGYSKWNDILVLFSFFKLLKPSNNCCKILLEELVYNNLQKEIQAEIDENPDYILVNSNGNNLLSWSIDIDSNAISYLTAFLNLSKVQKKYLFLKPKITNPLYFYNRELPSIEKKEMTTLHIKKIMFNRNYNKFVFTHIADGDSKKVWWRDKDWLESINYEMPPEAKEIYKCAELCNQIIR